MFMLEDLIDPFNNPLLVAVQNISQSIYQDQQENMIDEHEDKLGDYEYYKDLQ
jgi:hypothetical protein